MTLQDLIILIKLFQFCILSADPNIEAAIFQSVLPYVLYLHTGLL